MACKDCEERRKRLRDAIMHGKMAEAMDITVGGLREMIGIKADPSDGADDGEPAKTATLGVVGELAPEPFPDSATSKGK